MTPFGARLDAALAGRLPICVGIDPHAALLGQWGLTDDAAGVERFARTAVEALAAHVAVLKPQSAFFERHGSAGVAALERAVADARAAGALVVLDVKRGDIGSTMQAYAEAYLDPSSPLAVDAITVSPYLGVGALDPAFILAAEHGAGLFVLALTSNPEGASVQRLRQDGRSVAQRVVDEVGARNDGPGGSFGVVVGATVGEPDLDLTRLHGPVLVPGIGAQGGTAQDVARIFGGSGVTVLPAVSREVLRHGTDAAALRDAAGRIGADFTPRTPHRDRIVAHDTPGSG